MIFESEPWKNYLLKTADNLERRYNQKRWTARSMFSLEKEIFLGFFSVRKLMESNKVSDSIKNKNIQLAAYPCKETQVTLLNQHKFAELYDLYAGKKETLTYEKICNQFIHSSIYSPFVPVGSSLLGMFVASDRDKERVLYYITLLKIVEIMRNVGNNYPKKLQLTYSEESGKYVVKSAT